MLRKHEGFSFQLTAARRRLAWFGRQSLIYQQFQLTAARRRLAGDFGLRCARLDVSTHSRPKAAGDSVAIAAVLLSVSTHSRPKAAGRFPRIPSTALWFQLTAARRRLVSFLSASLL